EHGPDAAVDDLAARTALDARQPELLELIGGTGGTAAVARALTREVVFPRLARRLAVTLLRAVSAGARLRWPASPASSPGQPRCRSSVAAYHDLVRSASELASRVGELADLRGGRPCTPVGWEERFDRLEPLPLLESRLEESASRLSLAVELDSTGLRKSLTELLAVEAEAFATTYRELVPTVWQEGDMPLWPHRVLVPLLSHHRRTSTPQTTVLVVVDAMRRDLFRLVRAGLHSTSGSDLLQLEERTIWALAPTLTGLNMRALTERIVPGVGDLLGEEFPDEAACDRSHALPYAPDGVQLETIPEIAEHVHGSTLSLARLADAVVPAVVARLASIIDRARPGTLIAVAADHGFAEVAGWRPHASSRRWRHGGLDPFEVLVPLGVYQKAWSRSGE
ncbi:MAG: hypothetical protein HY815_26875, partial [Candidatus Riflebacteria bacterium]|nr:hypothetical protein [Candidatus Riflebacteria bacterium]